MHRPSQPFSRVVFGAALLATLGFGAAQAFAAPAAPAASLACSHSFCDSYCIGAGYNGGSCVGSPGKCLCY